MMIEDRRLLVFNGVFLMFDGAEKRRVFHFTSLGDHVM